MNHNVYRYPRKPPPQEPHQPGASSVVGGGVQSSCNNNNEGGGGGDSPQPMTRRRHTGHGGRSLLTGFRDFVRPRSDSLGTKELKPEVGKGLRRVQVAGCHLDSVYDLREGEDSDFYNDELAFRRPRSNSSDWLILRKTSRPLSVDVVGLVDSSCDPYRQYMKVVECYELAPAMGHVVVFDKALKVGKAFEALCTHNVGAALVWDSADPSMHSMLTLTDLLEYLRNGEGDEGESLRSVVPLNQLVAVPSDTKLLEVCTFFCSNRVHRIVVRDKGSGDIMYLLTIKRVLQAIHKQNRSLHFAQWLSQPIVRSGVGTWSKTLSSVSTTDSLTVAVDLMLGSRISSLPVKNGDGLIVDVLNKNDIAMALRGRDCAQDFFSTCKVGEALTRSGRAPSDVASVHDPVSQILDMLLSVHHRRCVFIVDTQGSLVACVSLSDVLRHILYDHDPMLKTSPSHNQTMAPSPSAVTIRVEDSPPVSPRPSPLASPRRTRLLAALTNVVTVPK